MNSSRLASNVPAMPLLLREDQRGNDYFLIEIEQWPVFQEFMHHFERLGLIPREHSLIEVDFCG